MTGRDITGHLIAGQHDPKVPARLARAAARRKISQLQEAVEGAEFFTAGHAALLAKGAGTGSAGSPPASMT